MTDDLTPAPTPEPVPPPVPAVDAYGDGPPSDGEPRRAVGPLAVIALLLGLLLLGAGGVVAWRGAADVDDADRELADARRERVAADAVLRKAEADLRAARAAVAGFGASAKTATAATARVVELEARLVDLLGRLRAAGEAAQIDSYNQLVDQLNRASDELVAAFTDLELPLQEFSDAIDTLPTARCAGPVSARLRWTAYGREGLECARLQVPLDAEQPVGPQIQITVVRRPADGPDSLGPLVLNPGGPGISAVSFLRDAQILLPPELLRRFDLVAFDPRGVGHSTPVDCADDLDPWFDPDLSAPTPAARDAEVEAVAAIARNCATRTGALLDHVDTVAAARDLDRLRAALGVEQISYLGFSYGTYLGAVYADLFPDRVRAAVLDGAVDPRRAVRPGRESDPIAFRTALGAALDDCAGNPSCPLFAGGDTQRAYDRLMARLIDTPLAVGDRTLGRTRAEIGVVSGLYLGQLGWPRLMAVLASADAGDGRALLALADSYTGRRDDGSYNDELEAHYAINCIDLQGRLTPDEARQAVRELSRNPARFETVSVAFSLPCAFWPVEPHEAPGKLDAPGAAPILVIGGEGDPVTPVEGAEALAGSLSSGKLVRAPSSGHTSFARGDDCIDGLVVAYLVSGALPPSEAPCPSG